MFDFEPAKVGKSTEPGNPDLENPSLSTCFGCQLPVARLVGQNTQVEPLKQAKMCYLE
jgi:hypothetical protein